MGRKLHQAARFFASNFQFRFSNFRFRESCVADRPWSSTAPPGEFRTYISADENIKEFTIRAVILGALFGLLFGAITVYVGLRAGLTVSASIPISVLSISILR